jgi:RimJ/RimL family protein N-acetyltransferase
MISLRDVRDEDLPLLYEQQQDPEAVRMAAFTVKDPNDRAAFGARWSKFRSDPTILARTVLRDERVVGSIVKYERDGRPEVTYWIGREFWGQGVATEALAAFLPHVPVRPLYASAAKHNPGSLRVLAKCGFTVCGEERAFANGRGVEVEEVLLRLD